MEGVGELDEGKITIIMLRLWSKFYILQCLLRQKPTIDDVVCSLTIEDRPWEK